MSVFQQVRNEVAQRPGGALFSLEDFTVDPEQVGAVARAMSRLYQQGVLKRLMKGLYFKPFMSIIGEVSTPDYEQLLIKLLALYKVKISYITGINVYNAMSLTTQIANEVVIATDRPRAPLQLGSTKVRFIRSHITEAIDDLLVVQLLDAIWQIKDIPATNPSKVAVVLQSRLQELNTKQRQGLARYALEYYPPQTRALAGLILERLAEKKLASQLKNSLNPLTIFRLNLAQDIFPTARNWNII